MAAPGSRASLLQARNGAQSAHQRPMATVGAPRVCSNAGRAALRRLSRHRTRDVIDFNVGADLFRESFRGMNPLLQTRVRRIVGRVEPACASSCGFHRLPRACRGSGGGIRANEGVTTLVRTTWRDRNLARVSQAGLVNNLNVSGRRAVAQDRREAVHDRHRLKTWSAAGAVKADHGIRARTWPTVMSKPVAVLLV